MHTLRHVDATEYGGQGLLAQTIVALGVIHLHQVDVVALLGTRVGERQLSAGLLVGPAVDECIAAIELHERQFLQFVAIDGLGGQREADGGLQTAFLAGLSLEVLHSLRCCEHRFLLHGHIVYEEAPAVRGRHAVPAEVVDAVGLRMEHHAEAATLVGHVPLQCRLVDHRLGHALGRGGHAHLYFHQLGLHIVAIG